MSDEPRGFTLYGKTPTGVEYALNVNVDAASPQAMAAQLKALDAAMSASGFTRSDRLDKPAWSGGGGRQQRPETPAPAGIVRPDHCGQAMKYVKYKKDGAKGAPARSLDPGWADLWVCSKDKQCEDVTSGKSERPYANFDMKPAANAAPATATSNSTPTPANGTAMNWAAFWAIGTPLGMKQGDLAAILGTLGIARERMTAADGERVIAVFKEQLKLGAAQ